MTETKPASIRLQQAAGHHMKARRVRLAAAPMPMRAQAWSSAANTSKFSAAQFSTRSHHAALS